MSSHKAMVLARNLLTRIAIETHPHWKLQQFVNFMLPKSTLYVIHTVAASFEDTPVSIYYRVTVDTRDLSLEPAAAQLAIKFILV